MAYHPKVHFDGPDRLVVESGGALEVKSGATLTVPDDALEVTDIALADGKLLVGDAGGTAAPVTPTGDVTISNAGVTAIGAGKVTAAMVALADGKLLVGGAGGAAAAVTPSGDVTISNAGVTAIGAGKVTAAMLEDGAGVAALLTAGLGASASYAKTTNGAQTLLASDAGARVALIVAVVTEVFADGDGTQPTFTVGETDSATKYAAASIFTGAASGDIFVFAGTLTAAKALLVTGVAATGTTSTGALAVTALVLPAAA